MTSSAPNGSETPGPNTKGLVARRRRRRRLGSSWREAGTLKPSGRRGVEISSIGSLFVFVVAVARVRAFALVSRGLAARFEIRRVIVLVSPIRPIHEPQRIKYVGISPID